MIKPERQTLGQELRIATRQTLTLTLELISFVWGWLFILACEAKDVLISRL